MIAMHPAVLVVLFVPRLASVQPSEYEKLKTEAEKQHADASYTLAHQLYRQASTLKLEPVERRWVEFRLADTAWRARAQTETPDAPKSDEARQQLETLVRDTAQAQDRDRVRAEVQESLGDFWWMRAKQRDWDNAGPHYQQALDWWAGASDIEPARQRYLQIVWKSADQFVRAGEHGDYYNWQRGRRLPLQVLENALRIAPTDEDRARAHFLIALVLSGKTEDEFQQRRVPEEFEAALKPGKSAAWHGDALFLYARWLEDYGRPLRRDGRAVRTKDGKPRRAPDYARALDTYRRLTAEYQKGETRFYDKAQERIAAITGAAVGLRVDHVFAPGSEIEFQLDWRNVNEIELTLYKLDLLSDVRFPPEAHYYDWRSRVDLAQSEKVRSWSKETGDRGNHASGAETIRLDRPLPVGAYVIEARAGDESDREFILVTDISLMVKAAGRQALVYVCSAFGGSPIANARISFWEVTEIEPQWLWRQSTRETNQDGLCVVERAGNHSTVFVAAALGDRQTFISESLGSSSGGDPWHIYVHTDRPAYRPNETVHWKVIARHFDGSAYSTPAGKTIEYEIAGRKEAIQKGRLTLNEFGSAWAELELSESLPLGEYHIRFWDEGRNTDIGSDTLFRLEEYKLPEFKVTVNVPQDDEGRKVFRAGERIEATIQAEYYFGGPVADATVEAIVHRSRFNHSWEPKREFPWLYPQPGKWRSWGEKEVKRESLKTDATGKATLSFDTAGDTTDGEHDSEYRIEARITDASRREIVGSGTIRVSRQGYYVYLRPDHNVYRPRDAVKTTVKLLDANDRPVQAEGTIKVTRDTWSEVWVDPTGREVQGDELRRQRRELPVFPPPATEPAAGRWQLKSQGYDRDELVTRRVQTNADGEADFSFTPDRDGFYRITWTSADVVHAARVQDATDDPITAETTVWVATTDTTTLGYQHDGIEIIIGRDTVRSGQNATVMLVTDTPGQHVLFNVEGNDFSNVKVEHLEGTVKVIDVPIEPNHAPNIWLSAATVRNGELLTAEQEIIVPPVEHVLSVEIEPDRDQYEPGAEGRFTVITRDHAGEPIAAEVSLAVVDESVYYIQEEYAGDPREFCYGEKRYSRNDPVGGFEYGFVKLVVGPDKRLVDSLRPGVEFEIIEEAGVNGDGVRPMSFGGGFGGGMGGARYAASRYVHGYANLSLVVSQSRVRRVTAVHEGVAFTRAQQAGQDPALRVRSDFRATAIWQPGVVTGKDGKATVKGKFPDTTTSWKATARTASAGTQFGGATATVRTQQPLIVRLQAPRFFLVGDTATVSAVLNNNSDQPMTVRPSLEAGGVAVTGVVVGGKAVPAEPTPVEIPAGGESRVDWLVRVERPGVAKLKVAARSDQHGDAMEKTFDVYEHGVEKIIAQSGKLRGDELSLDLDLPKQRKPDSTTLTVQLTPSLAATMLDALPYLIDYPYGCTEQTMSRFLPAAITAKTLRELGLKPEDVMERPFGGIVPEPPARSQPRGVNDLRKINEVVQLGLDRLYDFQHADGGWGWWKGGESDHFMTAYVVWGLVLARDSGIEIKDNVLDRAVRYLDDELVEEQFNLDLQAWMLHALAAHHASAKRDQASRFQAAALDNLWTHRAQLNAYTGSLTALSAHNFGRPDQAKALLKQLEESVQIDDGRDSAHWGESGIHGRWSEGGVEASAFGLRALLAIDPQHRLIEPVTNWLIRNRRGAHWSNTRNTAVTVLALNEFLRTSGELAADLEYELLVNGRPIAVRKVTGADALRAASQFLIDPQLLRDGGNKLSIRRKAGKGPLYFAATASFVTLEEPVVASGTDLVVERRYYRLVPRPTLLKGHVFDREPLGERATVTSGDRIEAVITIDAKNDLEYLVFEDLKPAGLETVQVRSESLTARELASGGREPADSARPAFRTRSATAYTGRTRWVHQELRDRKVALFIDKLPAGTWEIRYELRAEVPGTFHALPVFGQAMYMPELRGNGAETRLTVQDRAAATATGRFNDEFR